MLSEDLIEFVTSLATSLMCTRDAENRPSINELVVSEVTADRVVGLVPAHLAGPLAQNVADNGRASFLLSRVPGDHRSVQMKGRVVQLDGPEVWPEEHEVMHEQRVAFMSEFIPREDAHAAFEKLGTQPCFRVTVEIDEVYDQTPGPKAGQALDKRGAS